MASSKETYCLCGQPYNIGQFMIECDCCREWFHGSCVDVKIYHSDDIDKYHCPKCAQTYGPSVLKIPTNNHRSDRYELGAEMRSSQVGSPAWVRALAARPMRPTSAALNRMSALQFTEEFVRDNGFNRPILFATSEGLEMKTPNPATFTVRSVLRFCGAQMEVEVIDVRKQATIRMPLIDFVDYFETPPEHRDEKVLNVLSLEFSDTNMASLVDPPAILKRLDWAETVWPAAEERPPRPAVQKYCLMSAQGSYTDFHVDFGGTSVWYHVLHGKKIFYLIPPTTTNLALYQQWSASNNQNERFFGDQVEWYGTAELTAGQTMFIPTGWIHAVLTPRDSLVFGGNLLHSYAIEMQLQIYEIERRVETPTAFRYPLFEAMHWYAGAHLLTMLRRHNEETQDEDFTLSDYNIQLPPQQIPPLLLRGIKILTNALKEWHALKSTDSAKRDNVPKCLNSGQLVRELCKELRTIDKRKAQNKDKDFKIKTTPPKKSHAKLAQPKKSLKLTLPKPIMHNVPGGQNGEFAEEKIYADKLFIDNKEVLYDSAFATIDEQTNKLLNGLQTATKDVLHYQNFQVPDAAPDFRNYVETDERKNILRIKLNSSPSSSRAQPPPPYPAEQHSILKSQLTTPLRSLKPAQQWTISKQDGVDCQEQQILYTNDQLPREIAYGAGMYSAEDIQADYSYSAAKPAYQPDYGYQSGPDASYTNYQYEMEAPHQSAAYSDVPVSEPLNGAYHHNQLPSYDAAIAQQYATTPVTTNYVIEEQKPPVTPVRRSERPVRRRVSNTYDYEDADLFIDETPAPRRRPKQAKHKAKSAGNQPAYRPSAARPAPTNGIESLIQASVLAEVQPPDEPEDAAVAGMLSIGEQRFSHSSSQPRTFGLPQTEESPVAESSTPGSSRARSRKAVAASSADEEMSEDEDVIKEVHRDDEYVYPSLEMSSDEDEEWTTSRRRNSRSRHDSKSKSDKDSSWSPRARLGRLVPRLRGPARAGNAKRAVLATKSRRPPPPAQPAASNKNSRLKKGMKTAKQRLGKILKIHKMIY
ncbi:cupin-like domain-containing protein [Phthorimaea operculella]|nr:cupin-like domain-containing protein [Phthorimaea operculella]